MDPSRAYSGVNSFPDFDNGSPKSKKRWEQRSQQSLLVGHEHNPGISCSVGERHSDS